MNSRDDLLKAQITQSQKEIETNEKVAQATNNFTQVTNELIKENKIINDNQKVLLSAINETKESFESFSNRADTLTQENIQALDKAVSNLKNVIASIDTKLADQVQQSFDSQVATLKNNVSQNTKALTDTTTKAQEIIKNGYDNFNMLLNEEKKELQQQVKSISSKFSFLFIITPILLIIPTLYCLQWQFNFIPFLNKAPITDMFIMGFVCAIALVILLVILAKIISAKLQN